ncbi:rtt106-domain-containing protein [Colletotrichum asianum]
MPRRGTSSRGGRGGKAAGGAAKRKRDASDAGNLDGIQKRRTDNDSKEEGREWTKQYYQGKSVLDEDMKGMGCGWCRLITPEVPFQSPFACAGNIEVSSGTEGPGGGSIRLCGPKNYFGFNKDGIFDAIFLIPFRHIEQIFMLPNASKKSSDGQIYDVIIVPTGATGSLSIKREYPQMISFTWPEKKADKELGGTVGEAADEKKDTYSTVLKQVLNDQLKAFDKEVIDLGEDPHAKLMVGEEVTLSPLSDARFKSDVDGRIHFLNEGTLFTAETQTMFLPFNSLENVMLIQARDGKGKTVGLSLVCSATEPFYKDEEEGGSKTMMKFRGIDYSLMDGLEEYMKAHDIQVMLCEQSFYDYKKDKPMTGFMPLMR